MPDPEPRSEFTAEEREEARAIEYARKALVLFGGTDHDLANLARQYLLILGLSEEI